MNKKRNRAYNVPTDFSEVWVWKKFAGLRCSGQRSVCLSWCCFRIWYGASYWLSSFSCSVTVCSAVSKNKTRLLSYGTGFIPCLSNRSSSDYARSTRPDFRQDVQTYIFLDPPSVLTLTDLTFDFHIFGVLLWEWLTLFPKWAPFSQIAHLAMTAPPNNLNWSFRLITLIF